MSEDTHVKALAAENARLRQERDEARTALAGIHQAVHGADADRHKFPNGCADLTIEVQELVRERDPARMVMELVHARDTLEKSLTAADCEVESLRGDVERYKGWLAIANRELNEAIAEAAVLRHRDRRTQAVVRGLSAWVAQMRDLDLDQTAADILGDDLVAAVDAYEKGPTEAPASPLPAEQPPVEGTAADGLEAQGGAQRAARVFHAVMIYGAEGGWSCRCGASGTGAMVHPIGYVPRVWNAGDPEPEGVEKVTDSGGQTWTRHRSSEWMYTEQGFVAARAQWGDLVYGDGPLTEVLPEPAVPTAADREAWTRLGEQWKAVRDQTRADAKTMLAGTLSGVIVRTLADGIRSKGEPFLAEAIGQPRTSKPDGEVPEAGRAGEAQEACSYSAVLDPDANKNSSDVRPQDRTEGLDAAIEAALPAFREGWIEWGRPLRSCIEAAVRAASPLIERAALLAAAEAIVRDWSDDHESGLAADWLRDRATRTETS